MNAPYRHDMTLIPRYFIVTWDRGHGCYVQHFVPMNEPNREGYPKYTQRVSFPKETALRYAQDVRDMGGNAKVYESVEGVLYRVEV